MGKTSFRSFDEVIAFFGGDQAVADLVGVSLQAVSNWRAAGLFPSDLYAMMQDELRAKRKSAPRSLWRQREPHQSQRHRAA
jgi:DNA-binding transcriptional regulator Cro